MNERIKSARAHKQSSAVGASDIQLRSSCDRVPQNRLYVTIKKKKGRFQHPFAEETPYFSGKRLILEPKALKNCCERPATPPTGAHFVSRASSVSKRLKDAAEPRQPHYEDPRTSNQRLLTTQHLQYYSPFSSSCFNSEHPIQANPSHLSLSSSSIFQDERAVSTACGGSSNNLLSQQSFFIRPAMDNSLRFSKVKCDSSLLSSKKKVALNKERISMNTLTKKNTMGATSGSTKEDIIAVLQAKLQSSKVKNDLKRTKTDSTTADSNFQDEWKIAEDKIESLELSKAEQGLKKEKTIKLVRSVFENRPSTIYFPYPGHILKRPEKHMARRVRILSEEESDKVSAEIRSGRLPFCVSAAFQTAGFKLNEKGSPWNVFWGPVKTERIQKMNKFQKINHFPGCWHIGRKDNLYRHISKMKRRFPSEYDFIPQTYLLCSEYERFLGVQENADKGSMWILKPCASSRGRGIKILNKNSDISNLENKKEYMVSVYISNPHLIGGRKYDLRIYVLVSSFDPLRVYIYDEGLVRFASENYTVEKKDHKKRFVHLTNYSINKKSIKYRANNNSQALGDTSKWALSKYLEFMEQNYGLSKKLWEGICDVVVKACIAVEPNMLEGVNRLAEHRSNCFELYGFDILVDASFKLWLMEVNVCPSLNSSSGLDKEIKGALICDIGNLIGCQPFDKKMVRDNLREERSSSLGLTPCKDKFLVKGERNLNELRELNSDNYLEKLSVEDWNMLFESEEEFHRKGTFQRIFPPEKNVKKLEAYKHFFECQRLSNIVLWRYLESGKALLETICKRAE